MAAAIRSGRLSGVWEERERDEREEERRTNRVHVATVESGMS